MERFPESSVSCVYLLGAFQVTMHYVILMEIAHAGRYLDGPFEGHLRRQFVFPA